MVSSLRLQNYRSYKDKTFSFSEETNILIGPNAIGKTNVLEAILISRVGSSYRAKDSELVGFGEDWCRIDTLDDGSERTLKLKVNPIKTKEYVINERVYRRLPTALKLPVVLFEPNHLRMLNGSPEGRRNYLDNFNEQLIDGYGTLLRKYNRTLAQRNSLLKYPNKPDRTSLFPWNIRLSQLGGQLALYRQSLTSKINNLLPSIYRSLSGDEVEVKLVYKPQFQIDNYENTFLKTLESNMREDIHTGYTSCGPHRDDFSVLYNNHSSTSYASRGELRTAILALKITELEEVRVSSVHQPIILLRRRLQ